MKIAPFLSCLLCSALLRADLVVAENPKPRMTRQFFEILRSGDINKLERALDQGASPNSRDDSGNTPLLHAAGYGDVACVSLLLKRGAEVNATNAQGASALMRAATDPPKIRLLLEHGADPKARSAIGNTALILAARTANSHVAIRELLAHGAEANATNNFGGSALMAAAAGGDS